MLITGSERQTSDLLPGSIMPFNGTGLFLRLTMYFLRRLMKYSGLFAGVVTGFMVEGTAVRGS